MGFLVSAGVWTGSDHEPPPSWWRRHGRPAALMYASWIYPQDTDPVKTQPYVPPVVPPRRLPAPVPRDVTATRINPVVEDVQQLMAWAGQAGMRRPLGPILGRSQSDLIPVNVPVVAGVVPGWDSAVAGGRRYPVPALSHVQLSYTPALAETPALTVTWAAPTVGPTPRAPASRPAAQDGARPVAQPADDLTSVLAPWRVDVAMPPRRPPAGRVTTGDLPPLSALVDVPVWFTPAEATLPASTRVPRAVVPSDGSAARPDGENLTAWQQAAYVTPQRPTAPPRPAQTGHADATPWRGIDGDPPSHAGLWTQASQPRPVPALRSGQDCLQLSTAQYAGLWVYTESAAPRRHPPLARPTWTQAEAALPSPVANLLIIIGGPYSLSATGVYVAGATVGEVVLTQ